MKFLGNVLKIVLLGYVGVCAYMYMEQRSLIYHPSLERPILGAANLPKFDETTIPTDDGVALLTWHAPAMGDKPVILFFHGNAGTLADKARKVRELNDYGYGIVMPAWRGFSGNAGTPTEEGLYTDARAALKFAQEKGYKNNQIVVYGESLGSGVATELALEMAQGGEPAAALVLYTPYTSIADAGAVDYWYLPVHFLTIDKYDTLQKIAAVQAPVQVLHGDKDDVIPLEQAKQVFAAARDPKSMRIVEGGHHPDLYDFGISADIDQFLQTNVK